MKAIAVNQVKFPLIAVFYAVDDDFAQAEICSAWVDKTAEPKPRRYRLHYCSNGNVYIRSRAGRFYLHEAMRLEGGAE